MPLENSNSDSSTPIYDIGATNIGLSNNAQSQGVGGEHTPQPMTQENRLKKWAAGVLTGLVLVGAGITTERILSDEQQSEKDVVEEVAVDEDQGIVAEAEASPEYFTYPADYDPVGILSESEEAQQTAVDTFMSKLVTEADIIHPYNVDGFTRQRFENEGKEPLDRASMLSLFTVNEFKGAVSGGSAFLTVKESDGRIQLSTIEHVADEGLELDDQMFDPSAKKVIFIPGIGNVDITESFSSFLNSVDLRNDLDEYVSIDLPVHVQDALQVLTARGEIAPLKIATLEEIKSLSVGDKLEMANVFGGGRYSGAAIETIRDGEIEMKFDLSPFDIDKGASDEDIVKSLEESFKYEGRIIDFQTFENAKNVSYLSCKGNSGAPVLMTTADGDKKVVAAHAFGVPTSTFTVYTEASNQQKDNGSQYAAKFCHFKTIDSLAL